MASIFEALHGRVSGKGRTNLIISHGFGTDQSAWDKVRPWLDERYRVYSYDLAGAGAGGEASFDPRRHGSLYGYADDLIAIVDELDLDGALFVGHSASGMIGAAASVARPEVFERMVLIGSSARYRNDGDYHGGFDQAGLDMVFSAMAANFQAWGAGFAPAVVGVPDTNTVREFSRTLFLMRPDIALAMARMIFQSDMRDLMPQVTLPTHIVQVRRDMAVPMAAAEWLHASIEGSTFDVIDAEGHLPHMTTPDAVVALLDRYLG